MLCDAGLDLEGKCLNNCTEYQINRFFPGIKSLRNELINESLRNGLCLICGEKIISKTICSNNCFDKTDIIFD
jgi:hypothetical protein